MTAAQYARVIRRLIAMNVMMTLEYCGAFFLYMVNSVAVPVVSLLVWLTVTYFVLSSIVSMLTGVWLAPFLAEQIRLGGLSPWLLRPAPYIATDIGNNIGQKIVKLPLLLPLVCLVAFVFRADLRLPSDPRVRLLLRCLSPWPRRSRSCSTL